MYTNLKNVQIIISLLKQHNIRHFVLSPGTRNTPFVHSIENDSFFICYSIVDERSAAYFALGLSEEISSPVGFSCTSSTATCNYLPAMEQAYKNNIPLLALTADRDNRFTFQMEDQSIRQDNLFSGLTDNAVNIPIVRDDNDIWYITQSVNKVLLGLQDVNAGPAHINFQVDDVGDFSCIEIPIARKITKIDTQKFKENSSEIINRLLNKKILIICGQRLYKDHNLFEKIEEFNEKYDSILSYDHLSNIGNSKSKTFLKTVLITESISLEEFSGFTPDIVITIGGHFWSFLKYKLRWSNNKFEHWSISEEDKLEDGFRKLTTIFHVSDQIFFEEVCKVTSAHVNKTYQHKWIDRVSEVEFPALNYSNFSVINFIMKNIPNNSILHTSILNSTRLACFCELDESVMTFSNIGADGIDGTLSTFIAQGANNKDNLSFLISGDLSFIYDVNSIVRNLNQRHRILVINNYVGSEFYTNFGKDKIKTIDKHIAAKHSTSIEQFKGLSDFEYLSARNMEDLERNSKIFFDNAADKPVIFEVFTDAEIDAQMLKKFYQLNYRLTPRAKAIRLVSIVLDKLGLKGKIKALIKR